MSKAIENEVVVENENVSNENESANELTQEMEQAEALRQAEAEAKTELLKRLTEFKQQKEESADGKATDKQAGDIRAMLAYYQHIDPEGFAGLWQTAYSKEAGKITYPGVFKSFYEAEVNITSESDGDETLNFAGIEPRIFVKTVIDQCQRMLGSQLQEKLGNESASLEAGNFLIEFAWKEFCNQCGIGHEVKTPSSGRLKQTGLKLRSF